MSKAEEKKELETTNSQVLDAIKELTTTVADLAKKQANLADEIQKSRKAGKF